MQYAIIEISGRQYWIETGKFIDVNNLNLKSGSKIFLRNILFAKNKTDLYIGRPYLSQIHVEAIVGRPRLGPKILVYKMKQKKKYRRKNGHRQLLSRLLIGKINFK
jgi:large subunit ribosomal protein L21